MTTELTRRGEAALDPFMPKDAGEAMAMAKMLSASGLLGKNTPPRPESVLLLMARGHALGMAVGQSLFAFHIIEGVPTLKAESQQAICLARHDVCEEFTLVSSSNDEATFRAKRRDAEPVTMSYTREDAKLAGLLDGPNRATWAKNPAAMLRARCITALGQVVFPDLLLGLNSPEEQAEIAEVEGRVVEVDEETGEIIPEPPAVTESRARRAAVDRDLKDLRTTGGEDLRQRYAEEDAVKAAGAPTEPVAAPEPVEAVGEPEPQGAAPTAPLAPGDEELREALVAALAAMTPQERRDYYAKLGMSFQGESAIMTRLSDEKIAQMLEALPVVVEAQA